MKNVNGIDPEHVLVHVQYEYADHEQYHYFCLGCGHVHAFSPEIHTFDGDMINPTITPSLLQSNPQSNRTCHSFINKGMIQYLGDCWHHLKNQTVRLPAFKDWPEGARKSYPKI